MSGLTQVIRRCVHAAALLVAFAALAAVSAGAAHAREELPSGATLLPVKKTTTVRGRGTVWWIDGPTVIPKSAEIRIELGTIIRGVNNASLDVQGGLKVHGTIDNWVQMHNIDFSPTREARRGLHFDMVDFHACTFAPSEAAPFGGDITIENATVQKDCTFTFHIHVGSIKLMAVQSKSPIQLISVPSSRKRVDMWVLGCWIGRLTMRGRSRSAVRNSQLKEGALFESMHEFTLDGCDVVGPVVFKQGAEESFKKFNLTKCNIFPGSMLTFERAVRPKPKREIIKLDKFYFGPNEGAGEVLSGKAVGEAVKDGADRPKGEGHLFAKWGATNRRKHELVVYDQHTRLPALQ